MTSCLVDTSFIHTIRIVLVPAWMTHDCKTQDARIRSARPRRSRRRCDAPAILRSNSAILTRDGARGFEAGRNAPRALATPRRTHHAVPMAQCSSAEEEQDVPEPVAAAEAEQDVPEQVPAEPVPEAAAGAEPDAGAPAIQAAVATVEPKSVPASEAATIAEPEVQADLTPEPAPVPELEPLTEPQPEPEPEPEPEPPEPEPEPTGHAADLAQVSALARVPVQPEPEPEREPAQRHTPAETHVTPGVLPFWPPHSTRRRGEDPDRLRVRPAMRASAGGAAAISLDEQISRTLLLSHREATSRVGLRHNSALPIGYGGAVGTRGLSNRVLLSPRAPPQVRVVHHGQQRHRIDTPRSRLDRLRHASPRTQVKIASARYYYVASSSLMDLRNRFEAKGFSRT